jgi:hypothetical protein
MTAPTTKNKLTDIKSPNPAAQPMDADWPDQEAAAEADRDVTPAHSSPAASRTEPGHKDSPMESLGKAITETVWDASGEADAADKPGGRAVEGVEKAVKPATRPATDRKVDRP